MKTMQQHLKECDREAVIDLYFYYYLFDTDLIDPKYEDVTIGYLKERMRNKVNGLIDRLID